MRNSTLITACFLACNSPAAKAHEFWIDPETHQVSSGETVVAHLRLGQEYEGSSFSFVPRNFRRFDFALGGQVLPVAGTVGDRPAVTMAPEADGLLVFVHETTDSFLTWSEWEKFVAFVEHKDAEWVLDAHAARGLDREGVREIYSRYAKSLVGVGAAEGADFETGLLTEFVALENPYTGDTADGIDVRLLYQGEPWENAQVEVFEKSPDNGVVIFTLKTGAGGEATVPVKPGHRYMLDAVVLREPEGVPEGDNPPEWESLWANLTFAVPE